jgi:two-component system, NtrC family, nitrogen regulation sensor histidine kinase NtrY
VTPLRRALSHEARISLLAFAGGAPALVVLLWFLWTEPHSESMRLTLTLVPIAVWAGCALALRGRFARPLQTLSNMIAALREGDYSIRARGADTAHPLGLAFHEVNALADSLRHQRLDALEATALLRRVMEEIDVAIFAFDDTRRLRLLNRGAEALLELPAERALGRDAVELGLADALAGATPRMIELAHSGRPGRWELRRGTYRWEGRPHELVVLSDLTRSLREEERLAWQRLIRVLSHEINNSLAPIKSIAGSLITSLSRGEGEAVSPDLATGLGVIEARAEALGRFIHAYAQVARLPRPTMRSVSVEAWVRRVAELELRVRVDVLPGPVVVLHADPDQLDALLINLVRNAADATLETGGGVQIGWESDARVLMLRVEDDGPGLADTSNLFVPFFTTKAAGMGIGLTLSRQIAEAHGGVVVLANRAGGRGVIARVQLPITRPDESEATVAAAAARQPPTIPSARG